MTDIWTDAAINEGGVRAFAPSTADVLANFARLKRELRYPPRERPPSLEELVDSPLWRAASDEVRQEACEIAFDRCVRRFRERLELELMFPT